MKKPNLELLKGVFRPSLASTPKIYETDKGFSWALAESSPK